MEILSIKSGSSLNSNDSQKKKKKKNKNKKNKSLDVSMEALSDRSMDKSDK